MVTATILPDVLRVSFIVETSALRHQEIVCYVRPDPQGRILVYYVETIWHARDIPSGPFTQHTSIRVALDTALSGLIQSKVMSELWSEFASPEGVRVFNATPDADLRFVEFDRRPEEDEDEVRQLKVAAI